MDSNLTTPTSNIFMATTLILQSDRQLVDVVV